MYLRQRIGIVAVPALSLSLLACPTHAASAADGFITAPGRADIAFDSLHDVLYISGTDELRRYDMASGQFLTSIFVGGQTLGMDISPDGKTLAVANDEYGSGTNRVSLIDLETGTSSNVNFNLGFYEGGTYSVAFDAQGKLLVSSRFLGSGWTDLRKYDPATHSTMTLGSVRQDSMLSASADRSVVGVAESNISDGRWGYYHSGDTSYASQHQWYDPISGGTSWFNYEIAVSRDGSQFAIPTYGGLFVGDSVSVSSKVGEYAGVSPIGAGYSPLADELFLPLAGTNRLAEYDSKTFTEIRSFTVPGMFDWIGNHAFVEGRTRVASDGTYVFTTLDEGVFFARIAPAAAVPEPSTLLLNAVGIFVIGAARVRRNARLISVA